MINGSIASHSPNATWHVRSAHEERHADVEFERHGLALDEAELSEVIAVVARVDHVRVVQHVQLLQLIVELLQRNILMQANSSRCASLRARLRRQLTAEFAAASGAACP